MEKIKIDINSWKRREIFEFFADIADPNYSFTTELDVERCYAVAKQGNRSFFILYCYAILNAINNIEEFRTRYIRKEDTVDIYLYNRVDLISPIKVAEDGSFKEVLIPYNDDFESFYHSAERLINAAPEREKVFILTDQLDGAYINISATPNLFFTGLKHTLAERKGSSQLPLVSVGKMILREGRRVIPITLSANHGLADGFHVGRFFEITQQNLDSL